MDKTYQIIWADDEIDALLDEYGKALVSRQHVDVIKCNNAAMLEEKLKNVNHRTDAVIVDANFTARKYIPSIEEDVSGLRRAMQLRELYKHIPFYLYTQRLNLSDLVDEDELSYFIDNNAIFFKRDDGSLLALLDRIKNDVDKINSAEFQIDNQYKNELYYFQIFDKQCNAKSHDLIRELLIQNRDGSLTCTERYFNQFRSEILENMNAVAAHFGIVPEGLTLNDYSRFICSNAEKYKLNEDVLPKALHMLMQYVVRMVQDGSHKRANLQYEVHQFVSENKDTLIIQSLLFAIIELISWFIPYLAMHTNKQQNLANWQQKD
ncbi:MAG: hypothetical protein IKM77_01215 [Prevotella sp.]|nr:hypothetical protein [Prevotella sp.]